MNCDGREEQGTRSGGETHCWEGFNGQLGVMFEVDELDIIMKELDLSIVVVRKYLVGTVSQNCRHIYYKKHI